MIGYLEANKPPTVAECTAEIIRCAVQAIDTANVLQDPSRL